jgi:hypothetical protein
VDIQDDHQDHQHDSRLEDGGDVALCSPPKRKGFHTHRRREKSNYPYREYMQENEWTDMLADATAAEDKSLLNAPPLADWRRRGHHRNSAILSDGPNVGENDQTRLGKYRDLEGEIVIKAGCPASKCGIQSVTVKWAQRVGYDEAGKVVDTWFVAQRGMNFEPSGEREAAWRQTVVDGWAK